MSIPPSSTFSGAPAPGQQSPGSPATSTPSAREASGASQAPSCTAGG